MSTSRTLQIWSVSPLLPAGSNGNGHNGSNGHSRSNGQGSLTGRRVVDSTPHLNNMQLSPDSGKTSYLTGNDLIGDDLYKSDDMPEM